MSNIQQAIKNAQYTEPATLRLVWPNPPKHCLAAAEEMARRQAINNETEIKRYKQYMKES
jgi:hypothetical protein